MRSPELSPRGKNEKKDFAVSKNLTRYIFENNFVRHQNNYVI